MPVEEQAADRCSTKQSKRDEKNPSITEAKKKGENIAYEYPLCPLTWNRCGEDEMADPLATRDVGALETRVARAGSVQRVDPADHEPAQL